MWAAFYDIFVRHAFGSYRELLREVAHSPVMSTCQSQCTRTGSAHADGMRMKTPPVMRTHSDARPTRTAPTEPNARTAVRTALRHSARWSLRALRT